MPVSGFLSRMVSDFRNFHRDRSGANVIEFCFAFPIFILFFIFITEYGIMMFGNAVIRNTLEEAAHYSKIGCYEDNCAPGSVYSQAQIKQNIKIHSIGLVNTDDPARFTLAATNIPPLPLPGQICTWNQGQGGEIVEFRATYQWPVMFEFLTRLGFFPENFVKFQAITVVRNEPFGSIPARPGTCS